MSRLAAGFSFPFDELNFGMGFLEGESPEGERHDITSLNRYAIIYHDIFHKSRVLQEIR
jgi:hypothetical protein